MRQERKVVTVLFCDLVGFTSRAEAMDPEDVAALLGPYQARLKEELERYGGTVEKFIGDAVMALFGAPVAHEDDPERAVRAALAIRDFATAEGIELRIGITTGEALVNLAARPDAGETMATGDVVNTAARLQSGAPVGGILVAERTYAVTRHTVDYREAASVDAKGKAQPVKVWEALSAAPLHERAHTTPLVGREHELAQLRDALARATDGRMPQLVTLLGPPGIGKSRLVYEVSRLDGELSWRKGRCLPYGDGVAFWALGEIVKQQAGILDSDSPDTADAKLEACSGDAWVASHLRPLVGAGGGSETLGDRRAEAFSAWRRFLTALADEHPLALVFDDIHWADDGLLDFVSQLVEWVQESPLFVLCTARPELLERRPAWAGATVTLAPLSDEETGHLLSDLVGSDAPRELVTKAAGNPLYAEQYARLIAEGRSPDDPPETVQAIIAARLDALPLDEKSLLQDAAVVGRVFWSGAVAALAGADRWSVEERLLPLEKRELVRREPTSEEGQEQYTFRHVLLRDVAYAELPRSERAEKHVRAAEWIESLGRPEDHMEVLAHHYSTALTYGRADVELSNRARVTLRDAADRALGLGAFTAAAGLFRSALELWPQDDPERPYLLLRFGTALRWAQDAGEVELGEARDSLIAAGDPGTAAEAELVLADLALNRGQPERTAERLAAASSLVSGLGATRSKAYVLGHLARSHMVDHRGEEAIEVGRQAYAMAGELGLDQLQAHVLNTVGVARVRSGDPDGFDDLERSIELGLALNAVADVLRCFNNLAAALGYVGDLRRQRDVLEQGLEAAVHFGEWIPAGAIRGNLPFCLYALADWDEALRLADEFVAEVESGPGSRHAGGAYETRALVRLARDDVAGSLADARAAVQLAVATEPSLLGYVLLEAGLLDEAERVAEEFVSTGHTSSDEVWFPEETLLLLRLGREVEARALNEGSPVTRWRAARELILDGRLEAAADVYAEIGYLPMEAYLRQEAAQRLAADGHRTEAEEQLQKALTFWRSVGATRYIRECEQLLAASA